MKNRIVTLGLVLVLSLFVIFLRIRSIQLPYITEGVRSDVYDEIFEKIQNNANKDYANLPQNRKNQLISKFYKEYLNENKYLIEEKIKERAEEKKAFYQNDHRHTYFFGIDSYYWLRLIDNLINKGHIGDRIVNGQNYDDLVGMPIEQSLSRSLHLILGSFIYRIFGFLKLDIDYEIGLYFIPLLFSVLLVILTFFITKFLSQSNVAAFFASVAVNLSPLLLQRTIAEWLDTDIYNAFFPLLIFGAFLFVFKSSRIIKKTFGLIVFSFACSFYAGIWQGWWHIFDLFIICGLIFILNDYFLERKNIVSFKKNILWLFLLFVSGILFVGIFNGRESLFSFITEPSKLIFALKDVPRDNWPNVFLTVAELKKVSPYRLAQELGGIFIFFVSIVGSIYLILFKKIMRDKELGVGFFCLFIWLSALYYTSLNAIRFALLLIVPLGIMFGIVSDKVLRKIFDFSLKSSKRTRFFILGTLLVIIYLFMSFNITKSLKIISFNLPLMNDAWYDSLTFIKDNSGSDAIINSWWDYGHWFKALAQRRVLFDGKTQNSPIAFWMAKALITNDEDEAIGILRMLDISKNQAFDLLKSYGFAPVKAVEILREIIKLSKKDAYQYFYSLMEKEKVDKMISLLYNENMPTAYFIASYDMLGKMRSISHIGNWDFQRGDIWIHLSNTPHFEFVNYLKEKHGYTDEKANDLLKDLKLLNDREVLGWISKIDEIQFDSISNKFKKEENLLIFDNGLTIDLSNFNAYIFRGRNVDIGIPYSVVYMENGILKEKKLEESNLDFSVLLFKKDDDLYSTVFLDKDLSKSMFVRMYFFKGEGFRYFRRKLEVETPEGYIIYVYEIEWPM